MSVWLTAVLPVASALLGVLVANRASSQRDATARVWERRADTYVAIYDWTTTVENELTTESGDILDLPAARFDELKMSEELLTRLWVFASDPVRYAQGPVRATLFMLAQNAEPIPDDPRYADYEEFARELLSNIANLRKVIRVELSEGKLRIPISYRVQKLTFPMRRRVKIWRNHRRTRRGSQTNTAPSQTSSDQNHRA